jgi:glucose-6-phosphate-specific signal transduction histidine kinase
MTMSNTLPATGIHGDMPDTKERRILLSSGRSSDMTGNFARQNILWFLLITATSLIVMLVTVYSLSHGINDIFPFFFLVPVVLVAYAFPERVVMATSILGWIYILLVWVFGTFSAQIIAVHTAWFFVFISLGIVISHFAESSKASKKEVEALKKEAFQRIERHMEQFWILNDQIRNPLSVIMLDTALADEKIKAQVTEQVKTIEKILDTLDEGYLESEDVRKFLRDHYGFGKI